MLGLAATLLPQAPAALLAVQFVLATVIGVTTLSLMLYAWRDDEGLSATGFPESERPPGHSFSLIVPARHEEKVLATTLKRMADLSHPNWEVIVVVGDDDPGTKLVAREATAGDRRFRIIVDKTPVKNKPRALNTALPHCTGDVVGVFDAEDLVAPDLLLAVDRTFQQSSADIVQGAVALMNFQSSWFSVRNVLEYYFWFKSRLHFHAKEGYIPLGGNTVFVRRECLVATGGWDGDCLAEDCELGARLSARGARTVVAYNPTLVTREETPSTIRELLRQRTRWNQGFLQVLRKPDWKRLPLRSRALALYTLGFPALQALLGLTIPLTMVLLLTKLPITLALASFVPFAVLFGDPDRGASWPLPFSAGSSRSRRARWTTCGLIVGSVPYQLMLSTGRGSSGAGGRCPVSTTGRRPRMSARTSSDPALPGCRRTRSLRMRAPSVRSRAVGIPRARCRRHRREPRHSRAPRRSPAAGSGSRPAPCPWPRVDGAAHRAPSPSLDGPPAGPDDRRLAAARGRASSTASTWASSPAFFDDEGTYVAQAWAVTHLGELAPYTYWYDHPPLGWLLMAAWSLLPQPLGGGEWTIADYRCLMLVLALVDAVLLYAIAAPTGRSRGRSRALAVALFALSPLAVHYQRMVLAGQHRRHLDAPRLPAPCCRRVDSSPAYVAAGLCFAAAVLTKETFLLVLPALVLLAWQRAEGPTRSSR